MARRTSGTPRPMDGPSQEHIVDIDIDDEMRSSFLEYAYSVIYARALPDARDGLKPVQRRILFQMDAMGLRPDRGHVKSARVVGEVMGRLHPHGDSAIYDALVRMAQPFTLRLPFIDGHGNFGSPDDGPAAMRYTECRLAPSALAMTSGIDEDVVDFTANYDGRELEPTVLPAAIPALLVNGASGIAVGMATSIPPHNVGEVLAAAHHLVLNPDATADDLMRFVPGPDLPGGGIIVGLEGIRDAYLTGRGTYRVRAKARVEQISPRRKGIVVTELPPSVGPEKVIERIKELVQSKKLTGISDVIDLTDGESGLRLVIEVKNTVNPEALLQELYKKTPLEDSAAMNVVALVDGEPQTLSLATAIQVFVDHRIQVVRRRSEYRRTKAQERLHLVEGLLIAIIDIDEVITLIRASDDTAQARERLMSVFDLSNDQAQYILEMPLRRLTKFSRIELETERDDLLARIEQLTRVLEDELALRAEVAGELRATSDEHASPRRTVLLESAGASAETAIPLEVSDDPCLVVLSSTGLIARTSSPSLAAPGERSGHDLIVAAAPATARGAVVLITSAGRAVRVPVIDLPALPETAHSPSLAGGAPLGALVDLDRDERVLTIAPVESSTPLLLATRAGIVKRLLVEPGVSRDVWDLITLKDGDVVVGAAPASDTDEIFLVTAQAQALRFPAAAVRPQGRPAGGMAGIRLAEGDHVLHATALSEDDARDSGRMVTISGSTAVLPGTSLGSIKVSATSDIPPKGRGTGGVRVHRFLKGEDSLLFAYVGPGPLRGASPSGVAVDIPESLSRRDASGETLTSPIGAIAGPRPQTWTKDDD
jgi:DNA gyrase subunit A